MAYASLVMKNPKTGVMREAPLGYSWTMLFLFPFPALFRRDWWVFIILSILWAFVYAMITIVIPIVFLLFSFFYNKDYLKRLIKRGYKAVEPDPHILALAKTRTRLDIPVLVETEA